MGNPETRDNNDNPSEKGTRKALKEIESEVTDDQIFEKLDPLLEKMPRKSPDESDEDDMIYTNKAEDKTTIQIIRYISRIRDDTKQGIYWNGIKDNIYSLSPEVLKNVGPQILQLSQQFETMDIFASRYVSRNILRNFSSVFVEKNWETLLKIPKFISILRDKVTLAINYLEYSNLAFGQKATVDILIKKYLKDMIQKNGSLSINKAILEKIQGKAGKFGMELEVRQRKLGIEKIEEHLGIADKTQTQSLDEEQIREKYFERTSQIGERFGKELKIQQDALYETVFGEWLKAGNFDKLTK